MVVAKPIAVLYVACQKNGGEKVRNVEKERRGVLWSVLGLKCEGSI